MKQDYESKPIHVGVPVSLKDIVRRKEAKYRQSISVEIVRFFDQGNFTVCMILTGGHRHVGVSKRMPGDKHVLRLAEWMRESYGLDHETIHQWASWLEHKYRGDPPRVIAGMRLAFSRALDNAMQGWC